MVGLAVHFGRGRGGVGVLLAICACFLWCGYSRARDLGDLQALYGCQVEQYLPCNVEDFV